MIFRVKRASEWRSPTPPVPGAYQGPPDQFGERPWLVEIPEEQFIAWVREHAPDDGVIVGPDDDGVIVGPHLLITIYDSYVE